MLITFLIGLLIAAAVIYVLYLILGMISLPDPMKRIIYVIVGIILVLWLLNYFGIYHTTWINLPTR